MVTRAETTKEFEILRAERLRAEDSLPLANQAEDQTVEHPDSDKDLWTVLVEMLAPHGVEEKDLEECVARFRDEINTLQSERPLTVLAAAFGVGFLTGRVTR